MSDYEEGDIDPNVDAEGFFSTGGKNPEDLRFKSSIQKNATKVMRGMHGENFESMLASVLAKAMLIRESIPRIQIIGEAVNLLSDDELKLSKISEEEKNTMTKYRDLSDSFLRVIKNQRYIIEGRYSVISYTIPYPFKIDKNNIQEFMINAKKWYSGWGEEFLNAKFDWELGDTPRNFVYCAGTTGINQTKFETMKSVFSSKAILYSMGILRKMINLVRPEIINKYLLQQNYGEVVRERPVIM